MKRPIRLVALAMLVTVAAAVAGCGADDAAAPSTTSTRAEPAGDTPPQLAVAVPLPDDAVGKAVSRLDGLADDLMKASGIPGMAVAVVHGGKTVYAKGFGVKNGTEPAGPDNAVGPDTVFQVASVSKSLSASVVAQQVGAKTVDWNTPIVSQLPWFALSDPAATSMVSIGDMMSHRSGLPDHAGDMLEDLGYDRRQVLEKLRELPLDPFRISYAYTNFGFTAGAEAAAAAARKPWEDLAADVLFRPLGMTTASYRYADFERRPDRAVGHIRMDGAFTPRYVREADPQAPAGGASASVHDMTRWLTMILGNGSVDGKQIIDPAALLPALTPQSVSSRATEPAARSGFYGYGFNVSTTSAGRTQLSHSGGFELGAGSNILVLPSADVAIVALTNATPIGVPETLTAEFADLVQFGEIKQDWKALYQKAFEQIDAPVGSLVGQQPPADPEPAAPLASYLGTYANDFWGPATVTELDGTLRLRMGSTLDVELRHWSGNEFTFAFVTENAPPGTVSKATFDGPRLTLEYYNGEGKGVFTR
jgi:CubicO group peptidase (beta-lactamase class C family)